MRQPETQRGVSLAPVHTARKLLGRDFEIRALAESSTWAPRLNCLSHPTRMGREGQLQVGCWGISISENTSTKADQSHVCLLLHQQTGLPGCPSRFREGGQGGGIGERRGTRGSSLTSHP